MLRFGFIVLMSCSCVSLHVTRGEDAVSVEEFTAMRREMRELKHELDLQKLRMSQVETQLQQYDTSVAFYAYLSSTTALTDGSIVIYDAVVSNLGDGYSDISGTFTAPVSGLYSFTLFFIMVDVTTNLGLRVNDVMQCSGYGNMDHFGNTGTCTAIVELVAGDLVNVKVEDDGSGDGGVVYGGKYSGLTGFLLQAM